MIIQNLETLANYSVEIIFHILHFHYLSLFIGKYLIIGFYYTAWFSNILYCTVDMENSADNDHWKVH